MSMIQLQGVNVYDSVPDQSVYALQAAFLPDVPRVYREKMNARGKTVRRCSAGVSELAGFGGDEYWSCTAPLGHPDYCPHIAGDSGGTSRVLGMWYDDAVIAKYKIKINRTAYEPNPATSIQCVTFKGAGFLPGAARAGAKDVVYQSCLQSNQEGFYSCSMIRGHVDYCPHIGIAERATGIWYGDKTLKRYGLLAEGKRYPA